MAGTNVGSVYMNATLNQNPFNQGLGQMQGNATKAFGAMAKGLAGIFAVGSIIAYGKKAVENASAATSAFMGLKSVVEGNNKSFSQAQNYINKYTEDGLVPATNAAAAYKDLVSAGYSTKQIEDITTAFKNSAVYSRQAGLSIGEAVQTGASGLKNMISNNVDNVGVTKNLSVMQKEYAASIGTTVGKLTEAEVRQAHYLGIMEATKVQMGDAASYSQSYAGQIAQLGASFLTLSENIGAIIIPVIQFFLPAIQMAVNALIRFTNAIRQMFGLKTIAQTKAMGGGVSAVADGYGDMGDAAKAAGDKGAGAAKKAGKEAKKAQSILAGFDTLNILQSQKEDSASAGGGSGGGAGGGGGSEIDTSGMTDNMDMVAEGLDGWAKSFDDFMSKFKKGLDDLGMLKPLKGLWDFAQKEFSTVLPNLLDSLNKIKSGFIDMFTSMWNDLKPLLGPLAVLFAEIGKLMIVGIVGALNSLIDIATAIILNLQKIFTSGFSLLIAILTPIVNSLNDFFRQHGTEIQNDLRNTWQVITGTTVGLINQLGTTIVTIFDGLTQWFKDNQGKVEAVFMATWEAIWAFVSMIWQGIRTLFETIFGGITDFLKENTKSMSDTLVKTWDTIFNFLAPIWIKLMNIFTETFNKIKDFLAEWTPIIREIIGKGLSLVWEVIKLILDKINDFWEVWGGTITVAIKTVMDNISNIVSLVVKVIGSTITLFLGTIKNIINLALAIVRGDWQGAWDAIKAQSVAVTDFIKRIFQAFIDYIVKAFNIFKTALSEIWDSIWNSLSLAWDKFIINIKAGFESFKEFVFVIFNGVKEGVLGIWNGLLEGIRGIINMIIGSMNTMVRGLNRLKIDIPKVDLPFGGGTVGGGTIGFSIPEIPKLAKGGIVSQPTLAMVGEAGREAVMPLENNTGWINDLAGKIAGMLGGNIGNQSSDRPVEITLVVDGTVFGRTVVNSLQALQRQTGKLPLKI